MSLLMKTIFSGLGLAAGGLALYFGYLLVFTDAALGQRSAKELTLDCLQIEAKALSSPNDLSVRSEIKALFEDIRSHSGQLKRSQALVGAVGENLSSGENSRPGRDSALAMCVELLQERLERMKRLE